MHDIAVESQSEHALLPFKEAFLTTAQRNHLEVCFDNLGVCFDLPPEPGNAGIADCNRLQDAANSKNNAQKCRAANSAPTVSKPQAATLQYHQQHRQQQCC